MTYWILYLQLGIERNLVFPNFLLRKAEKFCLTANKRLRFCAKGKEMKTKESLWNKLLSIVKLVIFAQKRWQTVWPNSTRHPWQPWTMDVGGCPSAHCLSASLPHWSTDSVFHSLIFSLLQCSMVHGQWLNYLLAPHHFLSASCITALLLTASLLQGLTATDCLTAPLPQCLTVPLSHCLASLFLFHSLIAPLL
jgi:hypothetical protein